MTFLLAHADDLFHLRDDIHQEIDSLANDVFHGERTFSVIRTRLVVIRALIRTYDRLLHDLTEPSTEQDDSETGFRFRDLCDLIANSA